MINPANEFKKGVVVTDAITGEATVTWTKLNGAGLSIGTGAEGTVLMVDKIYTPWIGSKIFKLDYADNWVELSNTPPQPKKIYVDRDGRGWVITF